LVATELVQVLSITDIVVAVRSTTALRVGMFGNIHLTLKTGHQLLMRLLPCLLACGLFALVLSIVEIKAVDYLYVVDRWQLAILVQVVDLLSQTRGETIEAKGVTFDGNHVAATLNGSKNFSTCSGTADHNWHILRAVFLNEKTRESAGLLTAVENNVFVSNTHCEALLKDSGGLHVVTIIGVHILDHLHLCGEIVREAIKQDFTDREVVVCGADLIEIEFVPMNKTNAVALEFEENIDKLGHVERIHPSHEDPRAWNADHGGQKLIELLGGGTDIGPGHPIWAFVIIDDSIGKVKEETY